jgi:hypothetical protein
LSIVTTTLSAPRRRVKPARRANLTPLAISGEQLLTLTEGTGEKAKAGHYYLTAIPCDDGRAFRLEKFGIEGGDVYHVRLAPEGNSCECLGHLRHGHKTVCKHIASLTNLVAAGKVA